MKDKYNEKLNEIEERLMTVESVLLNLMNTLNERETIIADFLAKLPKGGAK